MKTKNYFVIFLMISIFLENCIFATPERNIKFYSQSEQDKFVYLMLYELLDKQDQGYYLEIGAGEPISINNTYFFEKNYQWNGTSIDISENLPERWYENRNNLLIVNDATQSNYQQILQNFPTVIDYLSLDVDGYYDVVLQNLTSNTNNLYKIITIEHDFYRYGDLYRNKEREILNSLGYYLLCPNVSDNSLKYEDWWIHPSFFPSTIFNDLIALDFKDKDHSEIIKNLQNYILNRN